MVYLIRRYLIVHFTQTDTIKYAALQGFENGRAGQRAFEIEMERLRKNKGQKQDQDELEKKIKQIEKENDKAQSQSELILKMTVSYHGFNYIVEVNKNLNISGKLVPFRVLVYREDDTTDRDYIDLKRMNLLGEELRQFIKRYLVIYIN